MTRDTTNDLTDRENAFRKVVESASCVIVILREDHAIAYFSPFAEKLTRFASAEVQGKDYFRIFLDETDHAAMDAELRRLLDGGGPAQGYEIAMLCRNGERRWMLWNLQRLDEYEGESAVLAIGHDVTESRHAREALRDREDQLQAVLDTAVDGIITIDEHGIIHSVNAAAELIFGYTADSLLGQNVRILMPSPYREEHDGYIRNYLRTGVKKIIGLGREAVGRRRDGSTFPLDLAISEVSGGRRRRFTGIVRDITERRKSEERVLQNERLAAIGQMITGLAHESRNAFQRSQACLEMLEFELEDHPDALNLVRRIQKAHDHLHHLYEEVRDYAAPIRLEFEVSDLAQVWRDTWGHLELARRTKDVALREETTGIDLFCEIDANACEQLFRNILENAIAACPVPGEIVIRCENATLDGHDAVRVAIRDNGPGIERGIRAHVFEPFFTTKTKGTGLGMAIASRIILAHGGRIAVSDDDSPGAELVVTIPRRRFERTSRSPVDSPEN